jgi:hypothetical protein
MHQGPGQGSNNKAALCSWAASSSLKAISMDHIAGLGPVHVQIDRSRCLTSFPVASSFVAYYLIAIPIYIVDESSHPVAAYIITHIYICTAAKTVNS